MATATKRPSRNGNGAHIESMKVLDQYVLGTSRFIEVPIADMHVDAKYQRDLNPTGINRIVAGFDINLFEPPTVNDRGDWNGYKGARYALIDGQHRKAAAKALGLSTVTCRVVSVPREQEAELFVRLNRQRIWLTPVQAYKAELASGNPAVREIDACLSERNLRLASTKAPGVVSCVQSLKKVYSTAGFIGVARVIDVAMLAWPEDDLDRFNGNLVAALNQFLQKNPRVDFNKLSERLSVLTARHLLAKASQRWHAWKQLGKSASFVDAIADEIGRMYRKHS